MTSTTDHRDTDRGTDRGTHQDQIRAYRVTLVIEAHATDPADAVDAFVETIAENGLRGFTYLVRREEDYESFLVRGDDVRPVSEVIGLDEDEEDE